MLLVSLVCNAKHHACAIAISIESLVEGKLGVRIDVFFQRHLFAGAFVRIVVIPGFAEKSNERLPQHVTRLDLRGEENIALSRDVAESQEGWQLDGFVARLRGDECDLVRHIGGERPQSHEGITPLLCRNACSGNPIPINDMDRPYDGQLLIRLADREPSMVDSD